MPREIPSCRGTVNIKGLWGTFCVNEDFCPGEWEQLGVPGAGGKQQRQMLAIPRG